MLRVKCLRPVASFTEEVNPRLAKRPLKINGRLANLELISLVKEATGVPVWVSGASLLPLSSLLLVIWFKLPLTIST